MGEQSSGCPAGPRFPEGAGEPSSCTGFAILESLGFPADFTMACLPSPPLPCVPSPPRARPSLPTPAQATARPLSGGIGCVCGKKCSCVFLCNKIKRMCRCSVFLQTLLLGCYKIKTIFSLSKCFPSKPLEARNSPAHLQLLFSWGWEEIVIVGPASF